MTRTFASIPVLRTKLRALVVRAWWLSLFCLGGYWGLCVAHAASPSAHAYSLPAKMAGDSILLRNFKGKKILIVNIASRCGYTKQLAALERIQQLYARSLVVIGVPSNDFLQTPEDDAGIVDFCKKNYGVTFPVSSVVHVKGDNCQPLFSFLTHKHLNGLGDFQISWNFNKFLLDEQGRLLAHFESKVSPEDALKAYFK